MEQSLVDFFMSFVPVAIFAAFFYFGYGLARASLQDNLQLLRDGIANITSKNSLLEQHCEEQKLIA
jgi:hypothetical protein